MKYHLVHKTYHTQHYAHYSSGNETYPCTHYLFGIPTGVAFISCNIVNPYREGYKRELERYIIILIDQITYPPT